MYLPTEGLYSECLRIDGLSDELQSKYKVIIVGPTTVTAIINSFSVGFKYLKISKSSKEINKILQAIKSQYETFGKEIENTKEKLRLASESTEKLEKRNDMISKKLRSFDAIEQSESNDILGIASEE
ncbi:MAG: DNA recombination protein RmuC, partial [Lachnospiraceae bacterium]|nr:DNA recombination protein RmuC [Lachnospiraceae bacterium]